MSARTVRTTCPYCGVGCGVLATRNPDGSVAIEGDPDHPANFGRLCSKGSALGETTGLDGRLLYPQIDGNRADWNEALDLIASTFGKTIAEHGPGSVAFYVSGQMLTEDYYAANKLMKGYIGAANIDTNSRLCMASSVAGHRRAFGADIVPGCYEDLELADTVVLVGSNLIWCHPVLYQRVAAAKAKRPDLRVVLIDPRRTRTADLADLHLAVEPDGDVALFNGLLRWIGERGLSEPGWIDANTVDFGAAMDEAAKWTVDRVMRATGLARNEIEEFYRLWTGRERVVTAYSQGVNKSGVGTDKVSAIINCHLATARIGRPGMGPFSLTGQPNAMGGREVGGLANMLAAHMEIENAEDRDRVQRFWGSPTIASSPGPKAVDMFRAVAEGQIKALWIMATNPVVSMPEADMVAEAIANCPFVVVSDVVGSTDTARHAIVLLPSLAWGEKDGTVTNSERRISRQRPFLPPPGEAKADWWQMAEIGKRMGWRDAFSWAGASAVFSEYAALTAFENGGRRDLDIGACAKLDRAAYDAMPPFQWPQPHKLDPTRRARFFAGGGFFTFDGKARFVAVSAPESFTQTIGIFRLNTGRVRDQWHTMTRTAKAPRLNAHYAEPYCEIHPEDAAHLAIADADLVRLSGFGSEAMVRALLTASQKPGNVFAPMHWNGETASSARINALVAAVTDPVSGQPALKGSMVSVERANFACHGFAVTRERPATSGLDYWALARCEGGWRLEFALRVEPAAKTDFINRLLGSAHGGGSEPLTSEDRHRGFWRTARFGANRLLGVGYLARSLVTVSRSWAVAQLAENFADSRPRWRILAGQPASDMPDKGAIVCACMNVGANEIATAARSGCATVAAIGGATRAGTNCGSCTAEIAEIIHANRLVAAE